MYKSICIIIVQRKILNRLKLKEHLSFASTSELIFVSKKTKNNKDYGVSI